VRNESQLCIFTDAIKDFLLSRVKFTYSFEKVVEKRPAKVLATEKRSKAASFCSKK